MAEQDLSQLMESVDARASQKASGEGETQTAEESTDKKDKKKKGKKGKGGEDGKADGENDDEKLGIGGKLIMFIVVLFIIAIWLAIFGLLVKMDVGGFGSTVLFPVLKDVPYVNMILPGIEEYIPPEDDAYNYRTVDEAIARIKELEVELEEVKNTGTEHEAYISELETSSMELADYKTNEAAFEEIKEKFYEEVVFSDNAPDINEYKEFYEAIAPENAEAIYKQVVTQLQEDKELKEYVETYSSMKPKNAAAIFNAMTDDYDLVCQILGAMDASSRSDILAAMDASTAAVITRMMEP